MICPPVWLCRCGCGGVTTLITKNNPSRNRLKDDYMKFISGHNGKGAKKSRETRERISVANSGERHWNWKGGTFKPNQRERYGAKSSEWRQAIYERDNYTCWDCGKRGGVLNAHHLKPWASYPELRFVLTNGITVCADPCHKIRTKRG